MSSSQSDQIDKLIESFNNIDHSTLELVNQIIEKPAPFISDLLAILEHINSNFDQYVENHDFVAHFGVVLLLGELRCKDAMPVLLELLSKDADDVDEFWGDFLTDYLAQSLAWMYDDRLRDEILAAVKHADGQEWCRLALAGVFTYRYAAGESSHDDMLSAIRDIYDWAESNDPEFLSILIPEIIPVCATDFQKEILGAYQRNLVDESDFSLTEYQAAIRRGREPSPEQFSTGRTDWKYSTPKAMERLAWQYDFNVPLTQPPLLLAALSSSLDDAMATCRKILDDPQQYEEDLIDCIRHFLGVPKNVFLYHLKDGLERTLLLLGELRCTRAFSDVLALLQTDSQQWVSPVPLAEITGWGQVLAWIYDADYNEQLMDLLRSIDMSSGLRLALLPVYVHRYYNGTISREEAVAVYKELWGRAEETDVEIIPAIALQASLLHPKEFRQEIESLRKHKDTLEAADLMADQLLTMIEEGEKSCRERFCSNPAHEYTTAELLPLLEEYHADVAAHSHDHDCDDDCGCSGHDHDDEYDWVDEPIETYRREEPKIGRNDPCPCGSGKKYKKCCLKKG